MAIITIELSTAHVQKLQSAIEWEQNMQPGEATQADAKALIVQFLKDYTLGAEAHKHRASGVFTEIDPT